MRTGAGISVSARKLDYLSPDICFYRVSGPGALVYPMYIVAPLASKPKEGA